jgi:hypothetical protein
MRSVAASIKKGRRVVGPVRLAEMKAKKHRQVRRAVRMDLHAGGEGDVNVRPMTDWDVC